MAYEGYGAKYTLTFSDTFQTSANEQYIATIYKKGYSGDTIEVNGDSSPVIVETDSGGDAGYRPFIPTKASLNLTITDADIPGNWDDITDQWGAYTQIWNATGFNFTEFINADIDTFLLELKVNQSGTYNIIWQGYYIYNTDVSLSEITPIKMTLQFSDVLLMKVNRFYNFPSEDTNLIRYFPNDRISLLEVIMRCCYFGKITKDVIIEFPYSTYNTYKTLSGGTEYVNTRLQDTYVQKNAFLKSLGRYETVYDILTGICSQYGLIAYYRNNKLNIKSYENLINATSRSTSLYTVGTYDEMTDYVNYTFVDYATENDTVRPLNSEAFQNIGRDQIIKFNYPVNDVTIENRASLNFNTPNYTMSSVSSYVQTSGGPQLSVTNSWFNNQAGILTEEAEAKFLTSDISPGAISIPTKPFYPYCTLKTQTEGIAFATKIIARQAGNFTTAYYLDSQPFDVSSGDVFAFSYSALTDGRLKNLPTTGGGYTQNNARPRPIVALILQATDSDSNLITYYYNASTAKFESTFVPTQAAGSLPLQTTTNLGGSDSDRIWYNLRGVLDVPNNAKLRIRHYQPYRLTDYTNAPDSVQLYLQYCNLQVFKGSNVTGLPTTQSYTSTFGDTINSDDSSTLRSNIFMMDAGRYSPSSLPSYGDSKTKNPMFVPSCFGNNTFDEFYNPAVALNLDYSNSNCINLSYSGLKTKLSTITSNILKNIGVNNVTIEGTYKCNTALFIGDKFNYDIIGYYAVNFVMMDYSIDFRNATYRSLLYSSEFTDTTSKTIIDTTYIK